MCSAGSADSVGASSVTTSPSRYHDCGHRTQTRRRSPGASAGAMLIPSTVTTARHALATPSTSEAAHVSERTNNAAILVGVSIGARHVPGHILFGPAQGA